MPEPVALPYLLSTPEAPAAEVLVIAAHPAIEQSRVNRRLLQAARALAAADRARVAVRDLYALYPDYVIDVPIEQAALAAARLVVWVHPIHWYSMPPLMKLWVDDVLAFGWAYGPGGHALRGKDLWLVASTGSPEESYRPDSYNRYSFDAFLPAYDQTAVLCGLRFLPPLLLHGAHRASEVELQGHTSVFSERLATWPEWPEIESLPPCIECAVPAIARPAPDAAQRAA